MKGINCEICFKPFGSAAPPRMLPCGHSWCTLCLGQILTASKCCPFCRKDLTILDVEQYPVNYSILEICEELCDSPYNMDNLKKNLQLIHEEHQQILSFVEDFNLKVHEHRSELEEMKKNVTKLKNFMATDNLSFKEVNKNLKLIIQTKNNVARIFSWKGNSGDVINFKIDSSEFKSDDWTNFLTKIPECIAGNQKFAALLMVDGVKKFAKLSIYENYLCLHSLETLQDTHDFVTICFQGLVKELLTSSSSKGSIYCFFDIQYQSGVFPRKVLVEVTDPTNFFSSQFLKFCTGELGVSYKGHEYTQKFEKKLTSNGRYSYDKDILIQTKNLNWINKDFDIYSRYFSPQEIHKTSMPSDSCFLTCTDDGAFEIKRFESSLTFKWPDVIGPIVDFHGDFAETFKEASLRKIIDCGIAFKVGV